MRRDDLAARMLVTIMAAAAAGSLVVTLAALRDTGEGLARERAAMHALGASGPTFGIISWCVARIPVLCALVGCAIVGAGFLRSYRRRAVAAGVLMLGADLSAQLLKDVLALALRPDSATLPSGHAVLALSASCALVMVAAPRCRRITLGFAGAFGTLGCSGVVAAYWHVPGDVFGAMALVVAWVVAVNVWFFGGTSLPPVRLRECAASIAGAAWCVVTFIGWGLIVNAFTIWRDVAAMGELVIVPLGVAAVVAWAARIAAADMTTRGMSTRNVSS